MNSIYCILVLALLLVTACATGPSRAAKDDLVRKWICVSAIVNGKPLPEETVRLLRLTLTPDRYKTEKGSEILFDSTYSVDSTRNPNQINMVGTEGALTGKEAQGIYSVQGDTLHICYTMPGEPRPASFESAPGSKAYLIVWKRN